MKKGKSYRSLYLPAWSIVAAVLTLLLIIAVSTYRNMSRETGRMEESLVREGLVIIRAIEAGVRADFPCDSARSCSACRSSWKRSPVSRKSLPSSSLTAGGESLPPARRPERPRSRISGAASFRLLLKEKGMVTRYRELPGGRRSSRSSSRSVPLPTMLPPALPRAAEEQAVQAERPLRRWAEDKMIALSLRLETFEAARRQDRHHTLLMAAILVALGTGALYFIFIVQNYYLVNRTLGRMKKLYGECRREHGGRPRLRRSGGEDRHPEPAGHRDPRFGTGRPGRKKDHGDPGRRDRRLSRPPGGRTFVRDREIELRRKSEGGIPLSVSVAPLRDDAGQEMGAVLLIRDLREIRALQEKVAAANGWPPWDGWPRGWRTRSATPSAPSGGSPSIS